MSATFTYQWQQNTGSGWTNIAGETAATLSVSTGYATGTQLRSHVFSSETGCPDADYYTNAFTMPDPCVPYSLYLWNFYPENMVWDGERYIVIDRNSKVLYSTDGLAWTPQATSIVEEGFASNGTRWATVNRVIGTVSTSDDFGVTWTTRLMPVNVVGFAGANPNDAYGVGRAFALASDGIGFCVLMGQGDNPNLYYSSDGISWAGVLVGTSGRFFTHVIATAPGVYYACAQQSGTYYLYKSSDGGATWSTLTPPLASGFNEPQLFPGLAAGEIIFTTQITSYSTPRQFWSTVNDGAAWTARGSTPPGCTHSYFLTNDGTRYIGTFYHDSDGEYRVFYGSLNGAWTLIPLGGSASGNSYVPVAASPQLSNLIALHSEDSDTRGIATVDLDC